MIAKPDLDPEQMKATSGRDRMTIDHPVQVIREADDAQESRDRPKPSARTARSLMPR